MVSIKKNYANLEILFWIEIGFEIRKMEERIDSAGVTDGRADTPEANLVSVSCCFLLLVFFNGPCFNPQADPKPRPEIDSQTINLHMTDKR